MTVFTREHPVYNVIVLDLPPGGFTYRPGTWTAVSDIRGNLKGGITTEPTYHSPGKWELGDMAANETVTLTYVADISTSQQSGEYKDIAWTEGTFADDPESQRVLGNDGTGFFVGTAAAIDIEDDPKVKVKTQTKTKEVEEVLGISTTLPATGANNLWGYTVAGTFGLGALLLILGVYLGKKHVKE
ncbi:LPXTG cell wall anchor domain-containing protein [candidate division WWE3 bacterium]|uniref:LPXTG cell wall anchor domain-containing protein n=1 Tax=candidate division WWE3 bacterium TaxID=2053526 RepID=A0A7X9DKE9_UNCKA|nr:LPXTG cell wall anchor domain-containing protein [candidate division WWE3 bacterium]